MSDAPVVDVWRVPLDGEGNWLPPLPHELERAQRFHSPVHSRRHLRAHAGLRAILRRYTAASHELAFGDQGKPYLAALPELQFNLSHSHEMALVAVSWQVPVGVDVEWLRPMKDCLALAERFFPPSEAVRLEGIAAEAREGEFFRCWTRIEAKLKARGLGLYGAGQELDGDWSVQEIDAGAGYTASVAVNRASMLATVHQFAG